MFITDTTLVKAKRAHVLGMNVKGNASKRLKLLITVRIYSLSFLSWKLTFNLYHNPFSVTHSSYFLLSLNR